MSRNASRLLIFITAILIFLPQVYCNAQQKTDADTIVIDRLKLDPDSVMAQSQVILAHSIAIDSPDGAFMALIHMSIKHWEEQEYVAMRQNCFDAMPWARRSPQKDAVAWVYNNIALSYYLEGDYYKASQNLYKALTELTRACGDEPNHTRANIFNNLGRINMRLRQTDKAIEDFDIAEKVCLKGKLYFQLGENYTERGLYFNSINKPDSAARYFSYVMDIGREINKPDLQAIASCNLGKTAIEKGDYREAIVDLQRAIILARGIYNYIMTDAMYAMGDVLCRQGKYKQAERILVAALDETKHHHYRDRYAEAYSKLAAVYRATGRYKEALWCEDNILAIRDTLTSIAKATAYNQLEMKYNTSEKDKELAQNQLLIARQKSKLTEENIWIAAIAGSIFLLVLILIGIYRNARQKERLQEARINALQQQNKIGILNAVVQGEENERARIARDLHDGIGGMLAAAMMRFMSARRDNDGINRSPAYNDAMGMLDQVGDEIRRTAHNLMPEVLQKQKLTDAVRSFCSYLQEDGQLKIDFQAYGSFDGISQDKKLNIYRILQELLKNIKQHAQARHALVQLVMNGQTLAITIEDDGKGFRKEEVKSGIGLRNLEARVHSMGGTYSIESEPGNGTTIYIELEMHNLTVNEPS